MIEFLYGLAILTCVVVFIAILAGFLSWINKAPVKQVMIAAVVLVIIVSYAVGYAALHG